MMQSVDCLSLSPEEHSCLWLLLTLKPASCCCSPCLKLVVVFIYLVFAFSACCRKTQSHCQTFLSASNTAERKFEPQETGHHQYMSGANWSRIPRHFQPLFLKATSVCPRQSAHVHVRDGIRAETLSPHGRGEPPRGEQNETAAFPSTRK